MIVLLLASCQYAKDRPPGNGIQNPLIPEPQVHSTATIQSSENPHMRETVFPSYQLEEFKSLRWETLGLQNWVVYDIDQASDGVLWFATSNGVASFNGKNWAYYRKKDGLFEDESLAIKVAKNGMVWAGSADGRISSFDQKTWKTYSGSWGRVRSITEGQNGTLWFGASCDDCEKDGGVISFDGANWKRYSKSDGLPNNNVNDVFFNSKGELLVTSSGGLSIFRGEKWLTQSVESFWLLDEKQYSGLSAMDEGPNGIVWINSARLGLIRLKSDGSWNTIRLPGLGGVYTALFTSNDNTVWVAGYSDPIPYFLAHFDGTVWQVYKQPPFRFVNKILQLPDKDILFATDLGVVELIDPASK